MCVLEVVGRVASGFNLVSCWYQTTGRQDVTGDPCTKFSTVSAFKPLNCDGPRNDCYLCLSLCFLSTPSSSSLLISPSLPPRHLAPLSKITDISSILLFNVFNRSPYEEGTALCDRVHLERAGVTEGVLGGLTASPDSCCKMERSWWDHGGGVQRPQSLNTNVLLMPHCEGHQEHKLNEAFIVASVYNNGTHIHC